MREYSLGVDFGRDGERIVITKSNGFTSKVIANDSLDALIKKGKKYRIQRIISDGFVPEEIQKKIRKLIKD